MVGQTTLFSGHGALQPGRGPVRTGVTIILPHSDNLFLHKVQAAVYTLNGYGKAVGFEQVRELGVVESPIALTNTLNVGLVADALVQHAIRQNPGIGIETGTVNVIVGETNDGYLNDIQGRHVRLEHVLAAIENASSVPVREGAVGAGTGTLCMGWKGGIGTASRILPVEMGGFCLGALVQSNFGSPGDLVICGVPVGQYLSPLRLPQASGTSPELNSFQPADRGSVMIVLATDAPLDSRQLSRLCVRAGAGLARVGSNYGHGSGDFVIAFSTAWINEHYPESILRSQQVLADEGKVMEALFRGVVESVEEAVLNTLAAGVDMTGRDQHRAMSLPVEDVLALIRRFRNSL
jgi:D-aminopeptidase